MGSAPKTSFRKARKVLIYALVILALIAEFGFFQAYLSWTVSTIHPVVGEEPSQEPSEISGVSMLEFDLGGLYWLPFLKFGTCDYVVKLDCENGEESIHARGSVSVKAVGLCSRGTLKEIVHEKIRSDFLGYPTARALGVGASGAKGPDTR